MLNKSNPRSFLSLEKGTRTDFQVSSCGFAECLLHAGMEQRPNTDARHSLAAHLLLQQMNSQHVGRKVRHRNDVGAKRFVPNLPQTAYHHPSPSMIASEQNHQDSCNSF
jgi:hypothetical protein